MKKQQKVYPKLSLEKNKGQIKKILETIGGDGHMIWKVEPFVEAGLPQDWIDMNTHVLKSDRSNFKSTIFNEGKVVESVKGIYGLDCLWQIANDIDADTKIASTKIGRGFQAGELTTAIMKKLES